VPLPKLKATWSKPSEPEANDVKSNGSHENNNSKPTNQEKINNNNSVFYGNKSSKVAPIELESVDVDEAVNSDGEGGGSGSESKQSSKPSASSSSPSSSSSSSPLAQSRGSATAQVVSPSSKTNEYIEVEYDPAIHKFNNKKKKTTTNIQANEVSRDDQEFAERSPRANCLFAAGFTIPKSFIAALYSMAYYTPGFMELVEALLNPSRYDQASIPWLFKVCIVSVNVLGNLFKITNVSVSLPTHSLCVSLARGTCV
jgi:hypothetical protein